MQRWSMDFVQDSLRDGRKFRALTLVDQFSRQCPAIVVDTSISGQRVTRSWTAWLKLPACPRS